MDKVKDAATGVKAVKRALDLLSCFTLEVPELSLVEICSKTGLPKAEAIFAIPRRRDSQA